MSVSRLVIALVFATSLVFAAGDSEAQLADAVERGDSARVEALLAEGANVNATQPDGQSALHWAAYQDDTETAERLVRAGANVTAENRYGVTPLAPACINGNAAVIELLLNAGADANTVSSGGDTALILASRTGKLAAVEALLARGADVNAVAGATGQTALMWAAAEGNVEVASALLDAEADLNTRLDVGFTPFLFAVREARLDMVRMLIQRGADPNEIIETTRIPRGGRPRNGTTALMIATTNANYELGAALLEAGADPNASMAGFTALHLMAKVRNPGVGDNDPPPDVSGSMTSIEYVKALAAHGANLDKPMTEKVNLGNTRLNKIGATPFFLAAQSADAELMRALVDLGADPLLPNIDGSTPLMAALGLGTRSPGEDAGTEPEVLEASQLALDLGNDINAIDANAETTMHATAYKNLPKVVQWVADNGADIKLWHKRNQWGWTPLEIAEGYRFGNFKPSQVTIDALHKVMLAQGVDPTANRTPVKSFEIY